MGATSHMRLARSLVAAALACVLFASDAPAQFEQLGPTPVGGPLGTPAADVKNYNRPMRQPIPRGLLIAAGVVALAGAAVLLWASARAWRAANLFDRQYRFPAAPPAALRFGGTKYGGHMAVLEFGNNQRDKPRQEKSAGKDAEESRLER